MSVDVLLFFVRTLDFSSLVQSNVSGSLLGKTVMKGCNKANRAEH